MAWNPFKKSSWQQVGKSLDPTPAINEIKNELYKVQGEVVSNLNRVASDAENTLKTTAKSVGDEVKKDLLKFKSDIEYGINHDVINPAKDEIEKVGNLCIGEIKTAGVQIKLKLEAIPDKLKQGFNGLIQDTKDELTKLAGDQILKKLGQLAKIGSSLLPEATYLSLPLIKITVSGLSTIDENKTTGIERVYLAVKNYGDLSWNYNSISKYILAIVDTGVDVEVEVEGEFELPIIASVKIGAGAQWSTANLVKAIDLILGEVSLTK